MCGDFIFVRVVSTVQSNMTSTSISYKCYVCCRGRRISEIILFYFNSFYVMLLLSNIQGISNECSLERCVAFMLITLTF